MKTLANYPVTVQEQIKATLTAYDCVTVLFYNGKYHVSTNMAILDIYPEDFKVCEDIKASDIYTESEMKYNYSQL
jgi:hypothetical protein